jgi:hypothetical protein
VRTRLLIALAVIGVLAIGGVALSIARDGEDEQATGTDLTAIRCPLQPNGEPAEGSFDTAELIGLNLGEARAEAAEHTCEVVVSLRDGRGVPVPVDVDPKRIYVYTEDGVVTEIEGVGGGI